MSIWNKYPDFSPQELRALTAVTAQALAESDNAPAEASREMLEISPLLAARRLLPLLQPENPKLEPQQIQKVLEDEELSTQICLSLLGEVRNQPELADRVARAYEARAQKMAVTETLLLTGAVVILAMKIKKIRWGKDSKEIDFYDSGEAVKSFILKLLGAGGG